MPQEATGEVKAEHRQRQALVHIPCEGLWVGCFGALKQGWFGQLKAKFWLLVHSVGALSEGCVRGRPWETGETGDHKGPWEVISGTYICLGLGGLLSRAHVCMRGQCQFKVPAGHMAEKIGCQARRMPRQRYHGVA